MIQKSHENVRDRRCAVTFGSPTHTSTDVTGPFTGVSLICAGMTLFITGVVRFIAYVMKLVLTRDSQAAGTPDARSRLRLLAARHGL